MGTCPGCGQDHDRAAMISQASVSLREAHELVDGLIAQVDQHRAAGAEDIEVIGKLLVGLLMTGTPELGVAAAASMCVLELSNARREIVRLTAALDQAEAQVRRNG